MSERKGDRTLSSMTAECPDKGILNNEILKGGNYTIVTQHN